MTIVDSLRRARRNADVSLGDVAKRSGVGITNLSAIEHARRTPTTVTAERVADALGVTFVPVSVRGRTPVATSAAAIAEADDNGDHRLAYRQFIQLADDLIAVDPVTRVVLSAEEPERTGKRWDDAVAALVEYRLAEAGAPLPTWVTRRQGESNVTWEPQRSSRPLPIQADPEKVPDPFRRRGILIEANELLSA